MNDQSITPKTIMKLLPSRSQWGDNFSMFKELVTKYPNYPGVLASYSVAVRLMNDDNVALVDAKTALQKALTVDPDHLMALEELAHISYAIYKNPGEVEHCVTLFINLIAKDIDTFKARLAAQGAPFSLAVPSVIQSQITKLRTIAPIIRTSTDPLQSHLNEMRILNDRGRFQEALHQGLQALKIFPECDSLLLVTASAAQKVGELDIEQKLLKECLMLETQILQCVKLLGESHYLKGSEPLATLYQELFLARAHCSLYWFKPMLEQKLMTKKEEKSLSQARMMTKQLETEIRHLGETLP